MAIQSLYRQARAHGMRAHIAIDAVRRHIAGPLADYETKLKAWQAEPDKRRYAPGGIANRPKRPVFYAAPDEVGMRKADQPGWMNHNGWFTDDFMENTLRPLVWLLPHGRFLAGYEASDWDGLTIDRTVYADADDAWRAADHLAERDAESEREHNERWNAAREHDENREAARNELKDAALSARNVVHAWRAQKNAGPLAPEVCQLLLGKLEDARETMRDCIDRIQIAADAIDELDMAGEF